MAKIVNLRQARKRRARDEKEKIAEANRLQFGRNKGERLRVEKDRQQAKTLLDGAKLQQRSDDITSSSDGDS